MDTDFKVAEINLSAPPLPYQIGRLVVEQHQIQGKVTFDPNRLIPYRSIEQMGWSGISGEFLMGEWQNLPTLNATALDYMLANPAIRNLLNGAFKGLYLYFPRTIYSENRGDRFIRYLDVDAWQHGDTLLEGAGFNEDCAALMLPGIRPDATVWHRT